MEKVTFVFKDPRLVDPSNIVEDILQATQTCYTSAATVQVHMKINCRKFELPYLTALLNELEALDVSTNRFMYETSHTLPLQNEGFHPTMGLVVATHPDMKDAVELVQLQIGTKAHTRIRNWKCRLRGTIITSLDDQPIKCRQDIIKAIRKARQQHKKNIRIKFGSLTGF